MPLEESRALSNFEIVRSWSIIVELISIYKRLVAFEKAKQKLIKNSTNLYANTTPYSHPIFHSDLFSSISSKTADIDEKSHLLGIGVMTKDIKGLLD